MVVIQYHIPVMIVILCYVSVYRYLANLPILVSNQRQKAAIAKRKRSLKMLIAVSTTHFLSWLPLNVINVVSTNFDSEDSPLFKDTEDLYVTYAICHLTTMTSSVLNPLLYGFMNESFKAEFSKFKFLKCLKRAQRMEIASPREQGAEEPEFELQCIYSNNPVHEGSRNEHVIK